MKLITVLTLCVLVTYSYAIHNGEIVKPNSVPYQVLLLLKRGSHTSQCGGALIKPDRVLTAAHCLKDRDSADIIVGAHRLHDPHNHEKTRQIQTVDSSYLYPHPIWAPGKGHDVGIVKLPEPFELNEYVSLLKLPYGLEDENFDGEKAKIAGWGAIDAENDNVKALRAIENSIISNHECHKTQQIDSGNICLSGKNGKRTCKGDSGSPLVVIWDDEPVHVGITSKGDEDCDKISPSVFTRVTSYLDGFVKKHLE